MSDPVHAVPFEAPDPSRLAPLFPGFRIEFLIATGGMGAVYKAVQISLDRPVAIKILPREFGRDQEFRRSFETEAKTMARLNHPNLIAVYDFGEADGMLFIIMEFVPGKTLFHSAHNKAVAQEEAARIVVGACDALAHAHEHGILHRDIKPGNILLDQQARPKIGDFGLARPIGAAVRDGETIFGTPHYTAPEVLKFPDKVDARADIFSIGVVFHELLTGRLPADDPRPASAIIGCDPKFDAIIRRATHPSADLRYASAAELAKEIRAVTSGPNGLGARTVRAPLAASAPAGRPQTFRPAVVRHSGSNAGVVLGILAIAGALLLAVLIVTRGGQSEGKVAPGQTVSDPQPPPPAPKPPPPPVKPKPRPEPAPEPEVTRVRPEPEPEPEPEVVKVEPAAPEPAPLPTFDVPGFLDKARTITRQRAAPLLAKQAEELKENIDAFERRVKRELREMDKIRRAFIEPRSEESFEDWRKDGNRLPENLDLPPGMDGGGFGGPFGGGGRRGLRGGGRDEEKGFFSTLTDLHKDYLAKQTAIDGELELGMMDLANKIYILGLRKQIERLTDPNEVPSVGLLTEEIEAVQANIKYFIALMRGQDSAAAKITAAGKDPAAAEDKKAGDKADAK
jgi:serine/threonine protein kinase